MIFVLSLFLAGGAALVVVGIVWARQPATDVTAYLQSLDGEGRPDEFAEVLSASFLSRVLRPAASAVAELVGRYTPVGRRDEVRKQLLLAGLSASIRADEFVAIQLLAAIGGFAISLLYLSLGSGSLTMRLAGLVLLNAVGVLAPQAWLKRKMEARKHLIFMDLPDVLDLLAISVEAGVAFEGAVKIVCQHFDSALASELSRTLKEMELGLPRKEALQNLKKRTDVPELSNFILALIQADALGMPIGRVLHSQAGEMRTRRRMYAREQAGQLPVKILFPLVLFIFPPILIVVVGPAFSKFSQILK